MAANVEVVSRTVASESTDQCETRSALAPDRRRRAPALTALPPGLSATAVLQQRRCQDETVLTNRDHEQPPAMRAPDAALRTGRPAAGYAPERQEILRQDTTTIHGIASSPIGDVAPAFLSSGPLQRASPWPLAAGAPDHVVTAAIEGPMDQIWLKR
jgi:hypothetical protein